MLSISTSLKGAKSWEYYAKLAEGRYYVNAHEESGQWFGNGTEPLELSETVSAEAFKNLLDGRSIDGHRALVQNAGDSKRQKGWDLTLSAPKSVSVAWALSSNKVRRLIER